MSIPKSVLDGLPDANDELNAPLSANEIRCGNALKMNKSFLVSINPSWENIGLMQDTLNEKATLIEKLLITL